MHGWVFPIALFFAVASFATESRAQTSLTLREALSSALATNPRLTAADRDLGIFEGRRIQSRAYVNPELAVDVDNAGGSGVYRAGREVETTLQISQIIELPNKRAARIGAASAERDSAGWQREATKLEILSETAVAFFTVMGAQRRLEIFDEHVGRLDRLTPLLQQRVDAGAASVAEVARGQVAADLTRTERERARTALANARRDLAALMGLLTPQFGRASGRLVLGTPPSFKTVLAAIDGNPQLIRWSAVRVQRESELLVARLRPLPDPRLSVGWRNERGTGDNSVRVGVSVALPVWDQNQGDIFAAQQNLEKAGAERAINKSLLVNMAGRAYDAATGAMREMTLLRESAIPNARRAAEAIESGYRQGRFTLLELLDAVGTVAQASLREQEATQIFQIGVATIEGLVGDPFVLSTGRRR